MLDKEVVYSTVYGDSVYDAIVDEGIPRWCYGCCFDDGGKCCYDGNRMQSHKFVCRSKWRGDGLNVKFIKRHRDVE